MTNEIIEYLEQLELSENEAKMYLTLLETGAIPVSALAKAAGINRTVAYVHIERLVEKGLVMQLMKGSRSLVAVTQPEENLKQLVEKKVQSAKIVQEKFPQVIQTIRAKRPQVKGVEETEIRYYKGINAVRKIYQEALKANELRSYVKVEEPEKIFSDNIALINEAFKQNLNLTIREIIYDSPSVIKDTQDLQSKNNRYSYKLMPKDLELSSEDILIYDEKVAIINYTGKVTSVVLHSRGYYNNSTELFDFIWKILS